MRTISGWTASMRFLLSRQSHFANTQTANDSLTPPIQTRSSTPPSRTVPKSASFPATSAACCLKTCPVASPTSPATSNMPIQPQHQKPWWLWKVSCLSLLSLLIAAVHILLFYKQKIIERLPTKMIILLKLHYFFLIAELLLPCSAWSVLLQSCSGQLLTLMTLSMLLEIY